MITLLINITLFVSLAAAVTMDTRLRLVPNRLTVPVIAIGVAAHGLFGGASGLCFSLVGLLAGLGLMLAPYMLGALGGGDVKLLAAVGALKGAAFTFDAFLCAAIAGGIIALAVAAARGRIRPTLRNIKLIMFGLFFKLNIKEEMEKEKSAAAFPYAGAIAIGAAAAFCIARWLPSFAR